MLIYIRLFLGMGITWYFEILNFALSSLEPDPRWLIFTDTLNMCQVARITQDSSFTKLYPCRVFGSSSSLSASRMSSMWLWGSQGTCTTQSPSKCPVTLIIGHPFPLFLPEKIFCFEAQLLFFIPVPMRPGKSAKEQVSKTDETALSVSSTTADS